MLTATKVAERMVLMRDGTVTAMGGTAELVGLADPYVRGFFQQNL